jgi:hypothetical protein
MNDRMAPAHPYQAALGTGIEWTPGTVRLWAQGNVTATAKHTTATAWDFWYGLHFREAFPDVTHWWFRSIWTGRIAVSLPDSTLSEDSAVWGWMTFDVLDTPRLPWTMSEGPVITIAPPYPPNEEQPANLPLRLSLARAILMVLRDEAAPDTWLGVTSLVHRDDLARVLPTTHDEAARAFGGNWRLAHGETTLDEPPRAALCRLLGLTPA